MLNIDDDVMNSSVFYNSNINSTIIYLIMFLKKINKNSNISFLKQLYENEGKDPIWMKQWDDNKIKN